MISFKIYRNGSSEAATDFDLGDLEFIFDDVIVSSRGSASLSSMIYISISDLIDGLLGLGGRVNFYEFVGADSSFVLGFEKTKKGIFVKYGNERCGPILLLELLEAINSGVDVFLSDPRNMLPENGGVNSDFSASRRKLKSALTPR